MATNCWEFTKCGREPGGTKAGELGVCPAATAAVADGFLGGKNGGRACTYLTGTFCANTVQGSYQDKSKHCEQCEFYKVLRAEHRADCSVLAFVRFLRERDAKAHREFIRQNPAARAI